MITIAVGFAFLGVFAYVSYARTYQPIMETTKEPAIVSATILYGFASVVLLGFVGITTLIFKDAWRDFVLPTKTELWSNLIFGTHNIGVDISVSIAIMACFYAVHIVTEAEARRSMDINAYSLLFQISSIVIVFVNYCFYPYNFDSRLAIGGFILLVFSTMPLYFRVNRFDTRVVIIACLSAIVCGVALATDGKIVERVIFTEKNQLNYSKTPVFLFYEFLTFFIPFVLTFLTILTLYGFVKTKSYLESALNKKTKSYFIAAFGSVLQFVGSVYALGIEPNSVVPPTILGTTPLASLFVSSILKEETEKDKWVNRFEYVSAVGVLIGLIIIFRYK
jgi:hypothetical protein